ncbi:MAG: hypothetical protein WC330_08320 [Candidatus Omnitrophota bacterium]|jgi:hypothetical protein
METNNMCPYLIELKTQICCSCHPEGCFCPSAELIKKCCYRDFENCSYFKAKTSLEGHYRDANSDFLNSLEDNNKKPKDNF